MNKTVLKRYKFLNLVNILIVQNLYKKINYSDLSRFFQRENINEESSIFILSVVSMSAAIYCRIPVELISANFKLLRRGLGLYLDEMAAEYEDKDTLPDSS